MIRADELFSWMIPQSSVFLLCSHLGEGDVRSLDDSEEEAPNQRGPSGLLRTRCQPKERKVHAFR
jgi:hypothetical protein